ncbi:DUF3025 domain-containing protein [Paraglaciecola sp. L3A3]|uniref:DUF3025 domain-containing protein n=1 Tax=Paraglaciecola sp. L3A3 TaxID=2686358 RepID=UPI00131B5894|nr:DUF3025 domain-containing protein [Paraglaciecola sp. L3A3]
MSDKWHKQYVEQLAMLPMAKLEQLFSLSEINHWPNADGLNKLALQNNMTDLPNFVCQSKIPASDAYYEQIIFQQKIIPTRPNSWHDLFNGLVWLQFPQTKALLNQLHVEDIEQYGLTPRTSRRNNLTHFDECGVIITYQKSQSENCATEQLLAQLQNHQWQAVFVEHRAMWGKQLNSFIFGHANLEMLLQPFIGLTGKWLAVEVEQGFADLTYQQQVLSLDQALVNKIQQEALFSQKKPLYPLPLLGIPGVWNANNNTEFYDNTDYFRPAPKAKV